MGWEKKKHRKEKNIIGNYRHERKTPKPCNIIELLYWEMSHSVKSSWSFAL